MKKTRLAAWAIAGSALLGVSTAAPAMATYSPPYVHDYTATATSQTNKPWYWGDNCYKFEPRYESSKYYFSHKKYFTTVVVKAGRQITVFEHFYGKKVYSENGKDISHIIVCKPSYK